jgi:hypothetical protein
VWWTNQLFVISLVLVSFRDCAFACAQVDDIGEVTITNDGATILKQLEVEHPAAKVLVELADLQVSLKLTL